MASPENPSEPAEQQQPRAPNGRFLPGRSANPGGRPAVVREVRSLARQYTEAAVLTLVSIAADRKAPAAARVSACAELLNRGHGRPEQATAGADFDLRDVADDFTPATAGEAANLYEQLMAGLVTTDSAAAALERAVLAAPPSPTREPEVHAPPPTEEAKDAINPCAAPAPPRVVIEEPRPAAVTPATRLERAEYQPPASAERSEEPAPEREESPSARYTRLAAIQEDAPLPPPAGPQRIA